MSKKGYHFSFQEQLKCFGIAILFCVLAFLGFLNISRDEWPIGTRVSAGSFSF